MVRALLYSLCILLAQMSFAQEAADPVRPVDQPAMETVDTDTLLVQTLTELAELRSSVDRLQRTLEIFIEDVAADLRAENARLRRAPVDPDLAPAEPTPAIVETPPSELEATPQNLPLEAPEFGYTVVKEWGRTPEMAASFPTEVSTLMGMVLLVPRGSSDEELTDLGEELRAQYDHYDNINIEVFDDALSAQTFADNGVAKDANRRVLTVSKYRASGRDLILLIRGDTVTVVDNGQ